MIFRFFLILFIFLFIILPFSAFADVERVSLTSELLKERIASPQLQEGILTLDLTYLDIDLTSENSEFKEQFYQQLQSYLTQTDQPIGLDFSHSLIKGDLVNSRLGLSTVLSPEALPQNLTITERKIIESNQRFSSQVVENMTSVILLRSSFKFNETIVTGKLNFKDSIFLQKIEAKNSNFKQEVDFNYSYFGRKVDFSESTFNENSNFYRTEFQQPVKFNKTQFLGESIFKYSRFKEKNDFSEAIFNKLVDFTHTSWSDTTEFIGINCRDRILFSNSIFSELISFLNSTFEKNVSFRNAYFRGLLNLKNVKLLGIMDFSNAGFLASKVINIDGFTFDSNGAKILGNTGEIGKIIYLNSLKGNETVFRSFIDNFRNLEQISDANQLEYKKQKLRQKQLSAEIRETSYQDYWKISFLETLSYWLLLNLLLLLSQYGTNFSLMLGIGLISIGYFGLLFWLVDRWRKQFYEPIIPNFWDIICMLSSGFFLVTIGILEIFNSAEDPLITLLSLSLLLIPIPLSLVSLIYKQGRYHDLMETSYFLLDGSMRQLQLLIIRLPVVPEFPFFRDRFTPLVWERRWNWLNYYDFSLNNFMKLGFNDIRLRDQHLPGLISTLVWYQWTLGLLYIALLLWTLSRTIPGLNLLIYLK